MLPQPIGVIDSGHMTSVHITPKLLKEIRVKLCLTQKQAAARCRVAWRTWAGWEGGECQVVGPASLVVELLLAEANSQQPVS